MNQKLLMNKKYFLVLISGIFLFSCTGMNATKDTGPINTSTGVIQGLVKDQVISWEDIPYAQPPVGDLRWRAPRSFEEFIPAHENKNIPAIKTRKYFLLISNF